MPPVFRKSFFIASLFLVLLLTYSNVVSSSQTTEVSVVPEAEFKVSGEAPSIGAKAYAVFDVESGEVIASDHTDVIVPIASVTKLATAASLLNHADLETLGTVTYSDVESEGRAGKLVSGDVYTYRELLFPLLLESSNDAAAFFERETGGEVIKQMNQLAAELQMSDTTFADASGLSDLNVSSVKDLITFVSYLHKKQPHVLDMSRLEQYVGTYTGWVNNSPVITASYRGGKHGYTEAANRTLVALFEEELGEGKRQFGYILLGTENIVADMAELRAFVAGSVVFE